MYFSYLPCYELYAAQSTPIVTTSTAPCKRSGTSHSSTSHTIVVAVNFISSSIDIHSQYGNSANALFHEREPLNKSSKIGICFCFGERKKTAKNERKHLRNYTACFNWQARRGPGEEEESDSARDHARVNEHNQYNYIHTTRPQKSGSSSS